jgi:hypothetical protein
MSVRADFTFDRKEHYRASSEVTRRTSARYFGIGFFVVGLALSYWNGFRCLGEYPLATVIGSALPWLALGAFWLGLFPFQLWRAARQTERTDPGARGVLSREVDEFGLLATGNDVVLELPWKAILKVVETEEFFLFFYFKNLAYCIPKRVLSPSDVATVRRLTALGLGARAEVRAVAPS